MPTPEEKCANNIRGSSKDNVSESFNWTRFFELRHNNALAMECLTFSPYILNIYGCCGQSAIHKLANFGNLKKITWSFCRMNHIKLVSKIKLQLGWVTWYWLSSWSNEKWGRKWKWGGWGAWDVKNNNTCSFNARFCERWWRDPKEIRFHMPNYANPEALTVNIDMYLLDIILWDILMSCSPQGNMSQELEAGARPVVAQGALSKWPPCFNRYGAVEGQPE